MTNSMDATELRYLTYSRGDICDRTIDPEYLQNDCPLDQTSSKMPSVSHMQEATASLGHLDKLPLETTQNIFSYLDLGTLTLLRSISRRMSLLVDSLLAYKEVITHCPNALRAVLSTQTAQYFTATDLYNALRAQECFLCGRFGALLYLLECRRCCFECLTSVEDLLPICKASAQVLYHFNAQTITDIPTLLSIPGHYGLKQDRMSHMRGKGGVRVAMVSYGAARKACAELQIGDTLDDDDDYEQYQKAKLETRIALRGPVSQDFMRDMDCMNYDPAGYNAGYGLEPERFMAAIRFPTLISGSDTAEWGMSCLGCLERARDGQEERLWNEQYTTEGMVKHLEQCQKAREMWAADRKTEVCKR